MEFVDPRKVLYSQCSIGCRFQDGKLIEDTIDQLVSGEISPRDIEPIRVCIWNGKMHSLDNRRLYAFKEAISRGCSFRTVPAKRSFDYNDLSKKMSSPPSDDYSVIRVRGRNDYEYELKRKMSSLGRDGYEYGLGRKMSSLSSASVTKIRGRDDYEYGLGRKTSSPPSVDYSERNDNNDSWYSRNCTIS